LFCYKHALIAEARGWAEKSSQITQLAERLSLFDFHVEESTAAQPVSFLPELEGRRFKLEGFHK
jgi:hypothetical protein